MKSESPSSSATRTLARRRPGLRRQPAAQLPADPPDAPRAASPRPARGTPSVVAHRVDGRWGCGPPALAAGSVHRSGGRTDDDLPGAPRRQRGGTPTSSSAASSRSSRSAATRAAFAGRNLVTALRAQHRRRTAAIGATANSTYWGVLALRAAGVVRARQRSLAYIRGRQHRNGGYAWSARAAPDSNDTAAAVLALHAAAGESCGGRSVAHAFGYLATAQTASRTATRCCRAAPPTASRRRGRSRPGTPAACATARRWRGCTPASCRSGAYNYQPGMTIDAGLRDRPGAPGRARASRTRSGRCRHRSQTATRRSGRSRAAEGPRASWSRRRGRPAWRPAPRRASAAELERVEDERQARCRSASTANTATAEATSTIWMPEP